jgi:hypothetical protein
MTVRSPRSRDLVGLVVGLGLLVTSCGNEGSEDVTISRPATSRTQATHATPPTTRDSVSIAEFAEAADKVCIATWAKTAALVDPDGEGGNKPLGLGGVVRQWADDLAAIVPPSAIAADWVTATDLLRRSGERLDDAERFAAVGDPRSGEAQSEALWELQPAAAEIITSLGVSFKACFVE